MTRVQRRTLEMLERVCGFRRTHQALFPVGSPGGEALSVVQTSVDRIAELVTAQMAAVDDPRWRARERASITRYLKGVTRTARQIARLDGRVERSFVLPTRRTDTTLLETAQAFLRDATPMAQRFIDLGMPSTFLADLRERTERFESAVTRRRSARLAAAKARAGLAEAYRRALDAVMTFDVIAANALADDVVTLGTWRGTRRIDRARKRRPRRTKG
jgi:hypothetical protein